MIVLDTDVVSELMRPEPDRVVVQWLEAARPRGLATTAVTTAEVRYGIERLPAGRRKDRLRASADDLFAGFAARQVLPFDEAAAVAFADLVAERERQGIPIGQFDAQIAAICRAWDADLATRDTSGFADTGIRVTDPWQHEA